MEAILHACFLEIGTQPDLHWYNDGTEIYAGDMGTEFGVPCVKPLRCDAVLPWIKAEVTEVDESQCMAEEDEWDVQTPGVCQSSTVSFENIHAAVDKLTDVTKMLSSKLSLDRLKSSCFSSSTGKVFHKDLESVKVQVYRKRWASVAQSVLSVNKFRSILVWGWNSDAYVDGSESSLSDKGLVAGVDEAITKVSWWEAMRVLVVLSHCMSTSARWCVSCLCHGHLLGKRRGPREQGDDRSLAPVLHAGETVARGGGGGFFGVYQGDARPCSGEAVCGIG